MLNRYCERNPDLHIQQRIRSDLFRRIPIDQPEKETHVLVLVSAVIVNSEAEKSN